MTFDEFLKKKRPKATWIDETDICKLAEVWHKQVMEEFKQSDEVQEYIEACIKAGDGKKFGVDGDTYIKAYRRLLDGKAGKSEREMLLCWAESEIDSWRSLIEIINRYSPSTTGKEK